MDTSGACLWMDGSRLIRSINFLELSLRFEGQHTTIDVDLRVVTGHAHEMPELSMYNKLSRSER